jgi:hypothetical protein
MDIGVRAGCYAGLKGSAGIEAAPDFRGRGRHAPASGQLASGATTFSYCGKAGTVGRPGKSARDFAIQT